MLPWDMCCQGGAISPNLAGSSLAGVGYRNINLLKWKEWESELLMGIAGTDGIA